MTALPRKARTATRLARERARQLRRWVAILRADALRDDEPRVFYGVERLPEANELLSGGAVKFQRLAQRYPNEPRRFNILCLGSSSAPPDAGMLVRLARRRGAAVVWNQDGVAYPGWYGRGWERLNRRMAGPFHAADHVFFQSEFCRLAADRFLGRRDGEVLYNAVDASRFTPGEPPAEPMLVLGGNQYQRYRLETALRTLALLPGHRLLVTGSLTFHPEPRRARAEAEALVVELGLGGRVEFAGTYSQREAPGLLARGTLLLHTKVNDPCPGIVLEAMACGLPVVYSSSGGTPELVGDDAGIGIETTLDWERDVPPRPEQLAEAVTAVIARLDDYRGAARRRVVDRFDLAPWVARHEEVFRCLVA